MVNIYLLKNNIRLEILNIFDTTMVKGSKKITCNTSKLNRISSWTGLLEMRHLPAIKIYSLLQHFQFQQTIFFKCTIDI